MDNLPFYRKRKFWVLILITNAIFALLIASSRIDNVKGMHDFLQILSTSLGSMITWIIFKQTFPILPTLLFHLAQVASLYKGFWNKNIALGYMLIFAVITFAGQIITLLLLGGTN